VVGPADGDGHLPVGVDLDPPVSPRRLVGLVGRAESGLLDPAGDAHAQIPALLAETLLPLTDRLVVAVLERHVENLLVVAAVESRTGRALVVRERVLGDEVPAPEFRRIEADLAGGRVDQTFEHQDRIRLGDATVGVDPGGVGQHTCDPAVCRRDVVLSGQ